MTENRKTTEELIMSLYDFVKNEAEYNHKEFKEMRTRFDSVEKRLDRIEGFVGGHEGRISALEDFIRILKTKLGFNNQ